MKNYFDVIVIGGGIIGSIISYELSKYKLNILTMEKNSYFADETSRANSGVIHGGFDPEENKLEAKLNLKGNILWQEEIFPNIEFPWAKIDSLILAFNENEKNHLNMLYERGLKNKVKKENLKILTKEEVLLREPYVNPEIVGALLCTSSFAIDPVKATLGFLNVSINNGGQIKKNAEVVFIQFNEKEKIFTIRTKSNEIFYSKIIINAAGHYADTIAEIAGYPDFKQTTRRGEYRILSRSQQGIVNSILFMVPTIHGKGVVVAPMLDGHILVGPSAEEGIKKEDTRLVTREKFDFIGQIGKKIIPSLNLEKTIMTLAGSRPIDIDSNDFIIKAAKNNPFFINAAGMQSPAIASAPAIAIEIIELVKQAGIVLEKKEKFNGKFKQIW